jgi:hypothetical protein
MSDDLVLRDGLVAKRFQEVECVPLVRRLPYPRLPAATARHELVVVKVVACRGRGPRHPCRCTRAGARKPGPRGPARRPQTG